MARWTKSARGRFLGQTGGMPLLDNARHEKFCQLTAQGFKRHEAYNQAGYDCKSKQVAMQSGVKLFQRPTIKARVLEIEQTLSEKALTNAGLDRLWVLNGIKANIERAIQAKPVLDKQGRPTGTYKADLAVANRGYEMIGKEFNMFGDRVTFEGLDGELDGMNGDQLRTFLRGIVSEVGMRVVEMSREEKREWIIREAPGVGLRVEDSGENPDGAQASENGNIQAIPEATGVPPTRLQ